MQPHLAAAALHQLALLVRQAVDIGVDLLRGGRSLVEVKLAAAQAELTVGKQLAAFALQTTCVDGQRAAAGMGDLAGLVIERIGVQGQAAAVAGNASAAVIQAARQRDSEVVAAGLRNLTLLAGEIVRLQIEPAGGQRAAVVIQHFAGAGSQLLLRHERAAARSDVAVARFERNVFPLRAAAAEIQALAARGQAAARQVLTLGAQRAIGGERQIS